MTYLELGFGILFSSLLAWAFGKMGLRLALFSVTGLFTLLSAVSLPFFFYKPIASVFYQLVHQVIADGLVLVSMILAIIIPGLYINRVIDNSMIKTLSPTGNRIAGVFLGLLIGITISRFLIIKG